MGVTAAAAFPEAEIVRRPIRRRAALSFSLSPSSNSVTRFRLSRYAEKRILAR